MTFDADGGPSCGEYEGSKRWHASGTIVVVVLGPGGHGSQLFADVKQFAAAHSEVLGCVGARGCLEAAWARREDNGR